MAQVRYTVFADAYRGYTIEVRAGAAVIEVVSGFPNEDRANSWIRERRKAALATAQHEPKLAPD